ncbi:MAG: MFS transporter [Acidobacteria bacterium]|nr:MAG: MFS transporter [Acidobacteriota bacterium]
MSASGSRLPPARISTPVKWIICGVAAVGFAFDIYSVLVAPLILQPALLELGNLKPGSPLYRDWAANLFWVPALAGGFFGLIGGYLTDRFGRRRILVWSIMLYTFSALAAGYSTTLPMLLLFRSLTFIGVCVEFVAAVAWLAELFPEPKTREAVLGYTQAFSSLGGALVTSAFYLSNRFGAALPPIYGGHAAWRYTLISAVIPAIPLAIIRPFLPESPAWEQKRRAGTLKRPSIAELFRPEYRRTTIVTALLFACGYGAAFGAIQQLPQIVPGLAEVAKLPPAQRGQVISSVQFLQEMGGLAGRLVLAALALVIVSRRALLRAFQVPGMFLLPFVFLYPAVQDLETLKIGIFCVGFTTVAQLSFWGNYLPRVYPTYLRGTGEGFAANVGGRMLGTSAAYVTTHLASLMPGFTPFTKLAYAAAAVGLFVYALGFALSFWLPEPGEKLPE